MRRRKSNRLASSSHGRKFTTVRARRTRCSFTPRAKSSIIRPATRTNIRPTRAPEVFRLGLSAEDRGCDIAGRAEHYFHELSYRAEPHDDLPQGAGQTGASGRLLALGSGSLPGDHRRWQASVDGGRLHDFALASVFGDDSGERAGRRRQLHSQRGEGHGGRLHRAKCLCTYSIPATRSFRFTRSFFRNYSSPLPKCPADLRRHARYPEVLFRAQAEAYRVFHMRDPQVFYNKEDIWEIAHSLSASRDSRTHAAHLRSGHLARRERARVSADPAFHPARQRQFDRVDGRAL